MTIQTFFSPTRIYTGAGAHQKIADVLKSYDSKRIFIAADRAVLNSEIMTRIKASLDANGIAHTTFSDIEPDPSDLTVAKAFEQCRSHGATALLAVGGGSTIEDRELLWRAMAGLTDRQRAAIVLRFYEDLSEADVAEILRCRPGTAKSLVSRGLEAMRQEMRGEEG